MREGEQHLEKSQLLEERVKELTFTLSSTKATNEDEKAKVQHLSLQNAELKQSISKLEAGLNSTEAQAAAQQHQANEELCRLIS